MRNILLTIALISLFAIPAAAQSDDIGVGKTADYDLHIDTVMFENIEFSVVTLDEALGIYAIVDEFGGEYLHVGGSTIPYDIDSLGGYSGSGASVGTKTCWWKPNPVPPGLSSVSFPLFIYYEEYTIGEGESLSHAVGDFKSRKEELQKAGWHQKGC